VSCIPPPAPSARRGVRKEVGSLAEFRRLAVTLLVTAAAASTVPAALSAEQRIFTATYTGYGHGQVHGSNASGTATLRGRGKPIGPSTLRGSASGVFVSRTCVVWSGKAVLKGKAGSLALTARAARACLGTDGNTVSFAGSAKVASGAGTFRGAHGTLSFHGTYIRNSAAVSISFKGRIS
jgi:hypothetical protein